MRIDLRDINVRLDAAPSFSHIVVKIDDIAAYPCGPLAPENDQVFLEGDTRMTLESNFLALTVTIILFPKELFTILREVH